MRARRWAKPVAVAMVLTVVVGVFLVLQLRTQSSTATLVAEFKDASPLEVGSMVKASGVRVGTVTDIELDDGVASVTMSIDDSVMPVHDDARLTIRPVNILGETYIDLEEGSADGPYLQAAIPVAQTGTALTLQGLVDTFDVPTSAGLAALVTTLGEGLNGAGAETKEAIRRLLGAMSTLTETGQILDGQNEVLQQLIDHAEPIAAAIAEDDGRTLDGLLENSLRLLRVTAMNDAAIRATLQLLPSTLRQAGETLDALADVADTTTPVLRDFRPFTDDLNDIAAELVEFNETATPALSSLDPVLAEADQLLRAARPVAADLAAARYGLRQTARGVRSASTELLDQHLSDLMTFVRFWALSTNGRDGLSHYFRGVFHLSPEALSHILQGLNQEAPPGVPDTTTDDDGDRDGPQLLPEDLVDLDDLQGLNLGGLLDGLLSRPPGRTRDEGSATGLNAEQELALLDQLLGGSR